MGNFRSLVRERPVHFATLALLSVLAFVSYAATGLAYWRNVTVFFAIFDALVVVLIATGAIHRVRAALADGVEVGVQEADSCPHHDHHDH